MDGLSGWPRSWRGRMQRPASGEWVTYRGVRVTPPTADVRPVRREQLAEDVQPLQRVVDDLVRKYDPGGYRLTCPVAGCRWRLDVPRMELDPEPLDAGAGDWVVRADGVPREDVELILSTHIDLHAVTTETDVRSAPLPAEPAP